MTYRGPVPTPLRLPVRLVAALAGGLCLWLAFPAAGLWWLAPVGVALLGAACLTAGAGRGLLVGLESQVPGIYKRNLPPLKKHYGFTDHEVEFFAIHIEADEIHGERGYQIVERHSNTPERRAEALEQVRQATEMRWQYMSGLHRAYVMKEDH